MVGWLDGWMVGWLLLKQRVEGNPEEAGILVEVRNGLFLEALKGPEVPFPFLVLQHAVAGSLEGLQCLFIDVGPGFILNEAASCIEDKNLFDCLSHSFKRSRSQLEGAQL